jgi:antagonist of KipI
MASLTVIRPGMLTTVQDLGRWGHQASGVPVSGPMDLYSHRRANRLVGNWEGAAALELTLIGPELEAHGEAICAIAGAEFEVFVGERPVAGPLFTARSGSRVRFGARRAGARATLAVRGGIAVPPVFGSRATSLISGLGPFGGRAVVAGDVLPVGNEQVGNGVGPPPEAQPLPLPADGARLRVVAGPHERMFTADAWETLLAARYVVTPNSNRMGYRLTGPALTHAGSADILSDATPIGSLQVPRSGEPILLMADRQTTGGYPKIATVITADLPMAGQLAPGDWIEFVACTRAAARDALRLQERRLIGARPGLGLATPDRR